MDQLIQLNPPKAHSKKQALVYQLFKMPGLREAWVVCPTKWGKTLSASVAMAYAGVERPNTKWRWVAPIYTQACIAMNDYFPKILPPEPHVKFNNSHLNINLPNINTNFEFWHAQNPGSLEGAGVHGYVFDEAAKMKPEVQFSARTTTTHTKGPSVFISYPQGKNWYYHGAMEAKAHMEWSFKNNVTPEKIFIQARTVDNPFIDPQVVANAKREMPDRLFRQFYLAEFIDDGDVFAGFRDVIHGPKIEFESSRQRWKCPDYTGGSIIIGADWGKTKDYTVFTAFDLTTRKLVGFERFYKTPYTEAVRRLVLFSRLFDDILLVRHDKTGLGNVIDDLLGHTELPFEGVTFTNPAKAEWVAQLITSVEQKTVWFPNWPDLVSEFETYEVKTNATGAMFYGACDGKHDDIISSLLLSHSGLIQYADQGGEFNYLEDFAEKTDNKKESQRITKTKTPLEEFYSDLQDEDDSD